MNGKEEGAEESSSCQLLEKKEHSWLTSWEHWLYDLKQMVGLLQTWLIHSAIFGIVLIKTHFAEAVVQHNNKLFYFWWHVTDVTSTLDPTSYWRSRRPRPTPNHYLYLWYVNWAPESFLQPLSLCLSFKIKMYKLSENFLFPCVMRVIPHVSESQAYRPDSYNR